MVTHLTTVEGIDEEEMMACCNTLPFDAKAFLRGFTASRYGSLSGHSGYSERV